MRKCLTLILTLLMLLSVFCSCESKEFSYNGEPNTENEASYDSQSDITEESHLAESVTDASVDNKPYQNKSSLWQVNLLFTLIIYEVFSGKLFIFPFLLGVCIFTIIIRRTERKMKKGTDTSSDTDEKK